MTTTDLANTPRVLGLARAMLQALASLPGKELSRCDERHLVLIILRCHAVERWIPGGIARRVRERCQAELRRRYAR